MVMVLGLTLSLIQLATPGDVVVCMVQALWPWGRAILQNRGFRLQTRPPLRNPFSSWKVPRVAQRIREQRLRKMVTWKLGLESQQKLTDKMELCGAIPPR